MCASQRSFTCTLRSNKELFKKTTEKARVKSSRLPMTDFKIDQFASNKCDEYIDHLITEPLRKVKLSLLKKLNLTVFKSS